jgi:hypothetical protein
MRYFLVFSIVYYCAFLTTDYEILKSFIKYL